MSFFKKLFGKTDNKQLDNSSIDNAEIEYQGFMIRATPYENEGQLQSCGVISKTIDGALKQHRFIRADRFTNMNDAVTMVHIKARQIIDEQGERIFDN